ncbi:MAG: FecR domain-containing protein [Deltaproteobacteria bacterium]|nr:FecR domain-containing protein [Deltaproteobacteria bacterium]
MRQNQFINRKMISVCLALLLALAMSSPAAALTPGLTQVGTVEEVVGSATITHKGDPKTITLQAGMPIYLYDNVKTQPSGQVRLLFKDQSIVSVATDTSLTIDEFVFDPSKQQRTGLISILWGKVKCLVNDTVGASRNKFDVITPTAVIGVRGTDFLVWVKTKTETRTAALKNAVDVASTLDKLRKMLLESGKYTNVLAGKPPTSPTALTADVFKEMAQGLLPKDAMMPDLSPAGQSTSKPLAPMDSAEKLVKPTSPEAPAQPVGPAAGTATGTVGAAGSTAANSSIQAAGTAVAAAAGAVAGAVVGAVSSALSSSKQSDSSSQDPASQQKQLDGEKKKLEEDKAKLEQEKRQLAEQKKQMQTQGQAGQPTGQQPIGQAPQGVPLTDLTQEQLTKPQTVAAAAAASQEPLGPPVVALRNFPKAYNDQFNVQQVERKVRDIYQKFAKDHPQMAKDQFIDNGNGTVTDRATGLMWQKDYSATNLPGFAHQYAEENNRKQLGGYLNWRLPTIEELAFLYLSVINNTRVTLKMPEEGMGLWTGDQTPTDTSGVTGYAFAWFYKSVFSSSMDFNVKVPAASGSFSMHAVKAVRQTN